MGRLKGGLAAWVKKNGGAKKAAAKANAKRKGGKRRKKGMDKDGDKG